MDNKNLINDKIAKDAGFLGSDRRLYYNLEGRLVCETVESFGGMCFLYTNFFGKLVRYFLNKRFASKLYALYLNSSFSKNKILSFIKKYNIDSSEFEENVSDFKSFNDFFIRKLKSGVRIIDTNPNIVVSPADSKLFVIENISKDVEFFVKNEKFDLVKFLKNEELAKEYEGGLMMMFRLAPYDYHRFHFPFDCVVGKPKIISGIFESVHPTVYKSGVQPLLENERHVTLLKSDKFSNVVLVSIGAMFVGKIIETHQFDKSYKKGDEIGYFEFGGSTIVLLFKFGVVKPKEIFIKNSLNGFETQVKFGQTITE
ncbi:phosphatidylserine decarboxylase [Candidatus Babeliales bacterium]|nr:phosphatidylserine decarboxylase [Candidatus Babeliales bacterium]